MSISKHRISEYMYCEKLAKFGSSFKNLAQEISVWRKVVAKEKMQAITLDALNKKGEMKIAITVTSPEGLPIHLNLYARAQGPVVQSMVSLTSSLRGQLVKCFTTLLLSTLIFFVEKMREAFALQKLLTFFQQKILAYFRY